MISFDYSKSSKQVYDVLHFLEHGLNSVHHQSSSHSNGKGGTAVRCHTNWLTSPLTKDRHSGIETTNVQLKSKNQLEPRIDFYILPLAVSAS